MNYTELIAKFWIVNEKTPLGSSAIALYLFLLEECRKNNGNDFSISDNAISQKLSLARLTINSLKSKLRNLGLIQYQVKSGLPSIYRIVSDISFLQPEIQPKQEGQRKETIQIAKDEDSEIEPPILKAVEEPIIEVIETPVIIDIPTPEISLPKSIQSPIKEGLNIPTLEEFMAYARTLEIYEETMDFQIKSKYETWVDGGWVNGLGHPIIKWQNNLKNTLPYLKTSKKKPTIQTGKIPTIKRTKSTYNE